MNFLRLFPLFIACAMSVPVSASDAKYIYSPPQTMKKELYIQKRTDRTITFTFKVTSIIGEATEVKLSAKVIGDKPIKAYPNFTKIEKIAEGKSGILNFVLPISEKEAKNKNLKIQGSVDYVPDYKELIKAVETDKESQYTNLPLKERLISSLQRNLEENLNSVEIIRFHHEN